MPVAGGGFEQCYNAQAVVTADSLLVVATDVVQAANDKQQLTPMLGKLTGLPEATWQDQIHLLADNGYFSAANVDGLPGGRARPADRAWGVRRITPPLAERFAAAATAAGPSPRRSEAMAHRLQHAGGPGPLRPAQAHAGAGFGIIKAVLGFRQFLLRGLDAVRGEWRLVTLAWNLKRMFALTRAA